MSDTKTKVYSYHTFILPFTWEISGVGPDKTYAKLKRIFENNCFWEKTNLESDEDILCKPDIDDFDDVKGFYKEYQYFYPFVRKSIYGFGDEICANFMLKGSRNNGEYHIVKNEYHYILNINSIQVRLVNTGVALFIMECENHGTDAEGNDQTDIRAIKNINDYGRRITLPFISEDKNISADRLEVRIPGIGDYVDDFKGFILEVSEGGIKKAGEIALNHMCDFVKGLLSYGSEYNFISRHAKRRNEIRVWPALDDRMYVAFAAESKIADEISQMADDGKYSYLYDDNINKSLYEIAYMDSSGSCSCPDRELRLDLIEKAMYKRWLPYGTLYTISSMGFGMMSSAETGGNNDYLYENFLICYLQMVYITVIQKASIVLFSREAAGIAKHFVKPNRKLSRKNIRRIMNLLERHAAFDNQLFFQEISSEQQAIEMYDMLKAEFRLESANESLEKYLTGLFEITETNLNIIVNTSIEILTWLSIVLSGGALIYSIFFASDVVVRDSGYKTTLKTICSQGSAVWIFVGLVFILSMISWIVARIRNRRK